MMGDVSAEPSMEEILSSIKRIIAEEGDPAPPRPRRAPARTMAPPVDPIDDGYDDREILELNDPMPAPPEPVRQQAAPTPAGPAPVSAAAADDDAAPIVSRQTMAATRGALDSLSRMVTRPDPAHDNTLEGLVREMLRPMLSDWLDANLPAIVERIVAREVAKIAGGR